MQKPDSQTVVTVIDRTKKKPESCTFSTAATAEELQDSIVAHAMNAGSKGALISWNDPTQSTEPLTITYCCNNRHIAVEEFARSLQDVINGQSVPA